ncbi:MAG: transglycosylase domain-containing protein [Proteobacteria bacterium]|nr:transglycosylase domain-containing protein [Pseudomonadota bacterium]
MAALLRLIAYSFEIVLGGLHRLGRFAFLSIAFNPRLGPLRHVFTAAFVYVMFALALVYVVAPIRGFVGNRYLGDKLTYDAERWLATAIYDAKGNFIGTYDGRLDSQRDVNWTDASIELGGYVANPDHKSIPVREVPDAYWQCLAYHEDRYINTALNPFGIDLIGVLKIPYTTVKRSIALKRPSIGVGGSTLPMQLARVIYKTPPSSHEGSFTKLRRKFGEWWLAPVIYWGLTKGGDETPLKQWAANHLWLAQRTGGQPLHGVEMTARVVFGKEAKDLTIAEQYVLASAVNKPIILLEGNERLNVARLDQWRYITEVRAKACAEKLIRDEAQKKQVVFELIGLASGPPDPSVKPKLQEALDRYAPSLARRATANPMIRANALLPVARFGIREEMKQRFGLGWREDVRGVTTTLDVAKNLAYGERVVAELGRLDKLHQAKLNAGFALDPARVAASASANSSGAGAGLKMPNITLVAANARGEIVRYWEAGETASYFGSPYARDPATGAYHAEREPRRTASTGKMITAIAAGNAGHDTPSTLYIDAHAPRTGLDTCAKGDGTTPQGRPAIVAFACSISPAIEWRGATLGQNRIRRLVDGFGFTLPPGANGQETPPSTAVARGLISGSPQRVHHLVAAILAEMTGRGDRPLHPPTLIKSWDLTTRPAAPADDGSIVPSRLVHAQAVPFLRTVLSAPLCYEAHGTHHGTLKMMKGWCATAHPGVTLHFAKTGTDTNEDPNQTVETWIAGGIRFDSGAAYSYVANIGTGSTSEPFAHHLNAGALLAPLVEMLLADLEAEARHGVVQQKTASVAGHR